MLDLIELFTHWQAGRSQFQLSESLGIDRKTIRIYLAPAIGRWHRARRQTTERRAVGRVDHRVVPELSDPAARALT
jgi:hypothetical protein